MPLLWLSTPDGDIGEHYEARSIESVPTVSLSCRCQRPDMSGRRLPRHIDPHTPISVMPTQTAEYEPLTMRTDEAVSGPVVLESINEVWSLQGLHLTLRYDYLLASPLTGPQIGPGVVASGSQDDLRSLSSHLL